MNGVIKKQCKKQKRRQSTVRITMTERHHIWVEAEGDAPEIAFTWRGCANNGIARAKAEAAERDYKLLRVWAEKAKPFQPLPPFN